MTGTTRRAEYFDRPFTILGLGRSGLAAADALTAVDADVRLYDEHPVNGLPERMAERYAGRAPS